jgi:excinuclease UvrABC ATPase subunit
VAQGHSVLVIEHDADTLAQSDWVVELGPGPGAAGGNIVYTGAPRELEKADTPWGASLRERIALHSEMVRAA